MEGGAHVVSEAISIGVPVIASNIPGNIGLLGEDYPGYYPVGEAQALAALMLRAQSDPAWLTLLEEAVRKQQDLVTPLAERRALQAVIAGLAAR
jgi:glycosyltransferase involved in cell wall biosynthesis